MGAAVVDPDAAVSIGWPITSIVRVAGDFTRSVGGGGRMPEFFDVVQQQRACRTFAGREIADDLVERILSAATFAPSAENRQPWVFIVVRDPAVREQIGALTRAAWRGGARAHSEARLSPSLLADVDRGAEGGVAAAPVLVVVCGDRELGLDLVMAESIFPAVQNLLLAATACGLGSALTTLPTAMGEALSEMLRLPATVRPMAVVPLGWPERALARPRRQPVADKTHRERFGEPWVSAAGEATRA